MTADEWQRHVTSEAARAIGQWLEGRGRLQQPIARLTLPELEAMAGSAIARFVVLASERIRDQPDDALDLTRLLLGRASAPSATARPGASATSTGSTQAATRASASARCAASTPARPSPTGTTA
jgi:hypothetical protein